MSRVEFGVLQTIELSNIKPGFYVVEIIENEEPLDGMWGTTVMALDPAKRLRNTMLKRATDPPQETISMRVDRLETELGRVRREIEQHVSYVHDGEEPPYHSGDDETMPRIPVRHRLIGAIPEVGEPHSNTVRIVDVVTAEDGSVTIDYEFTTP